jgi:N utilization substance protein B
MIRRQARELALQVLFQVDIGQIPAEFALQYIIEGEKLGQEDLAFTKRIVFGTLEHLNILDEIIAGVSHEWQIHRMAGVDRNIMRMALFEIFYCGDIPGGVAVNEAVELAKTFGGDDSSRFINGILGKIVQDPHAYFPEGQYGTIVDKHS